MLDLTQIEEAQKMPDTDKSLLKWAKIFKAETLEELERLTKGEEVFEKMVFTLKELGEDEKIRMQCQAREDYERWEVRTFFGPDIKYQEEIVCNTQRNKKRQR